MSAEIDTLHTPFIKFLRAEGLPYIRARSDRQSTIAKGAQDFTVFFGPYSLAIEFKTKGSDLDPDQKKWRESMQRVGAQVYVLRSLSDAVELVQSWRSTIAERWTTPNAAEGEKLRTFFNAVCREVKPGVYEKVRTA